MAGATTARIIVLILAAAMSWWVYVPVHELLHALGCVLGGGEVTRLELSPLYGAALLQQWLSFIAVGSDYAGQLTGFDTHGSDAVYLLTDLLPFVLTVVLGVPLLKSAVEASTTWRAALRLGLGLPIGYAPFISLTGDYYEMGAILVSRGAAYVQPALAPARWRSDDLLRLGETLLRQDNPRLLTDALGMGVAFALGTVLAFATYALGAAWYRTTQRLTGAAAAAGPSARPAA